jgi:hypothetical protein
MAKRNSRIGRLYERELPGGGYVAIDVSVETRGEDAVPHTRVFVERRSEAVRRSGHMPPCIAEADADDSTTEFSDLLRIARDNVAIARALLDLDAVREENVV